MRGPEINRKLLLHAVEHAPTLFVDCANCANPHSLFPLIPFEHFRKVYVLEVEMLYKFRDVIKQLPPIATSLNAHCIIISTFGGLFNYDNDEENNEIYLHAWELMRLLSLDYHVIVGVNNKNVHFAKQYCHSLV